VHRRPQPTPRPLGLLALLTLLSAPTTALAGTDGETDSELSLYSPLPVVLYSTRLKQPARDAPLAVTVIDRATIRASGAQDIPSLLRLVPGMEIARVGGGRTTVALHGFADQFQRTMQVLVDGRSVCDPGLGGVLWQSLPVALEDIERIEVMRGPASSLYGANAFAATVNIITSHPRDEQGVALDTSDGEDGLRRSYARYGGSGEGLDYRLSLMTQESHGIPTRQDYNRTRAASLRADYRLDTRDLLLMQAGLSDGSRDDGFAGDPLQPERTAQDRTRYLQLKWTRVAAPGDELSLQLASRTSPCGPVSASRPIAMTWSCSASCTPSPICDWCGGWVLVRMWCTVPIYWLATAGSSALPCAPSSMRSGHRCRLWWSTPVPCSSTTGASIPSSHRGSPSTCTCHPATH
jgi:outer membrane receptor protein involved in Fe transport